MKTKHLLLLLVFFLFISACGGDEDIDREQLSPQFNTNETLSDRFPVITRFDPESEDFIFAGGASSIVTGAVSSLFVLIVVLFVIKHRRISRWLRRLRRKLRSIHNVLFTI